MRSNSAKSLNSFQQQLLPCILDSKSIHWLFKYNFRLLFLKSNHRHPMNAHNKSVLEANSNIFLENSLKLKRSHWGIKFCFYKTELNAPQNHSPEAEFKLKQFKSVLPYWFHMKWERKKESFHMNESIYVKHEAASVFLFFFFLQKIFDIFSTL